MLYLFRKNKQILLYLIIFLWYFSNINKTLCISSSSQNGHDIYFSFQYASYQGYLKHWGFGFIWYIDRSSECHCCLLTLRKLCLDWSQLLFPVTVPTDNVMESNKLHTLHLMLSLQQEVTYHVDYHADHQWALSGCWRNLELGGVN